MSIAGLDVEMDVCTFYVNITINYKIHIYFGCIRNDTTIGMALNKMS